MSQQRFLLGQEHPHLSQVEEQEILPLLLARPAVFAVRNVRSLNLPWSLTLATHRGTIHHVAVRVDFESIDDVLLLPFEREYHLLGPTSGFKGAPIVTPGIGSNPVVDTILFYVRLTRHAFLLRRDVFQRYVEHPDITCPTLIFPQGSGSVHGSLVSVVDLRQLSVIADEWTAPQ